MNWKTYMRWDSFVRWGEYDAIWRSSERCHHTTQFPKKMDRIIRINVGWKLGLLGKASYTIAQSLQCYTTPILHQWSGQMPGKHPWENLQWSQ